MLRRCMLVRLDANSRLRIILLLVPLLDEIVTTFPMVGIPLVREQLDLNYTQIGLIFTVGDRSRRWLMRFS